MEGKCPKFTATGQACSLPLNHPAACYHEDVARKMIQTRATMETRQLIDAMQSGQIILAKNPACKKCKGRAYSKLPNPSFSEGAQLSERHVDGKVSINGEGHTERYIEHSICSGCGGYLFTPTIKRASYATKRDKPDASTSRSIQKTHSRKLETSDLTAARIAEQNRKDSLKPKPKSARPRNYMEEAAAQAARDVDNMVNWNGR